MLKLSRPARMPLILRMLYAMLLLPTIAHAQFSLVARQVGAQAPSEDTSYIGICSKDACRATLPVYFDNVPCVVNVRVAAPNRYGGGRIDFAAGPCRGGFEIRIAPNSATALYETDQFGASTGVFRLDIQPLTVTGDIDDPPGINDGVVRPTTAVELDIIAITPSTTPDSAEKPHDQR